jgi:NSS family neurotransmitter:Na+ symporter
MLMPLAGLLIALFAGWVMKRAHVADEIGLQGGAFRLWYGAVRYVSPVAIALIFLNVIGVIG